MFTSYDPLSHPFTIKPDQHIDGVKRILSLELSKAYIEYLTCAVPSLEVR